MDKRIHACTPLLGEEEKMETSPLSCECRSLDALRIAISLILPIAIAMPPPKKILDKELANVRTSPSTVKEPHYRRGHSESQDLVAYWK